MMPIKFSELDDIIKFHVMELLFHPTLIDKARGDGEEILLRITNDCTSEECAIAMTQAFDWLVSTESISVIEIKKKKPKDKPRFKLKWTLAKEHKVESGKGVCDYCSQSKYVSQGPQGKLICSQCWDQLDNPFN